MLDSLSIFRLLQLCSSNLPVGGYTFSQGMEFAIETGTLKNQQDVHAWIFGYARSSLQYCDIPFINRCYLALEDRDFQALVRLNASCLAMRETRELLLADTAMGKALLRLLIDVGVAVPDVFQSVFTKVDTASGVEQPLVKAISFPVAFAMAAYDAAILPEESAAGYAWTVIENQVLAAAKLLPMGQTDSQKMLRDLSLSVTELVEAAMQVEEDELGLSLPGLAMASIKHETQYSRLYRS